MAQTVQMFKQIASVHSEATQLKAILERSQMMEKESLFQSQEKCCKVRAW